MSGTTAGRLEDLLRRREQSRAGGGLEAVARQHDRGKLTARERLDLLLDDDSFVETDAFAVHRADGFDRDDERYLGDGVVTGHGRCARRRGPRRPSQSRRHRA